MSRPGTDTTNLGIPARFHIGRRRPDVLIIGGGIAGSSTAFSLAERGVRSLIVDSEPNVPAGASANHAAVILPNPSVKPDLMSRFSFAAFAHTVSLVERLAERGVETGWCRSGVLRLLMTPRLRKLHDGAVRGEMAADFVRALDAHEASEAAGVHIPEPALFFPRGGFIPPVRLCNALITAGGDKVSTLVSTCVVNIERDGESWRVRDRSGSEVASGAAIVFANASDSRRMLSLPLRPLRGQLTYLRPTPTSSKLRAVVCFDGYIIPELDGVQVLGATFDHGPATTELKPEQHMELLERLQRAVPGLGTHPFEVAGGRAAIRATTPDRLPIAGALPSDILDRCEVADRSLFVSTGHGSRGFTTAPFCAEIVACALLGEPSAVPAELLRAVAPARFARAEEPERETVVTLTGTTLLLRYLRDDPGLGP